MRHYLYLSTFVGLMLVLSSGCSKPFTPIQLEVNFTNNCPGAKNVQLDVKYEILYFKADEYDKYSHKTSIEGNLAPGELHTEEITEGADMDGDGALDYGDLDEASPATDVLCIKLDFLDADDKPNDIWVASMNTIVDGCTVEVTIDANCLASYEIKYPAIDGTLGSSLESGVFQRVDRTLPQLNDGDSSR
jgi:hypothetical protein